ncbi:hypothetical protein [Bacillus mycoides]|uniref:hypothetical protein n=1 Tax=Bacillus mycoides TaxID=1405 RepID=UPI0025A229A8|nr:hypothetical protein [Bacillus mycoides]MDM5431133.1 hypothetical protein [Bacillus mycoides]
MKKNLQSKKILSAGLALGVLFGSNLVTPEHKASAAVDASTGGTVVKTFGDVYNTFLREAFSNWLSSFDAQSGYDGELENIGYKAPEFKTGEFAITVFDFYKNQNFSKTVRVYNYEGNFYKNYTIKHGEQLVIKEEGVLILLNPEETNLTKQNFVHVTREMLHEGNLGLSLTNWQTFYLKKANQQSINFPMLLKFYPKANPGNFSFDENVLYNRLDAKRKAMATVTSEPISQQDFNFAIETSKSTDDVEYFKTSHYNINHNNPKNEDTWGN